MRIKKRFKEILNLTKDHKKNNPLKSSTVGYCQEIGFSQLEHRPPKRIKLKIGIFSYQRIGFLQCGQKEPGLIIDIPLGNR